MDEGTPMARASRIRSSFAAKSVLIYVALGAGCSAESPNPNMPAAAGTNGAIQGPVGVAGGAAGQAAAAAGTGATTTGGSSGAAARGGTAGIDPVKAGTGGSAAVAGMSAPDVTRGTAGAAAGTGGSGVGGVGGMSSSAGATPAAGSSAGPGDSSVPTAGCEVSPITAEMRSTYKNMNEAYYTKFASANGVIVATGAKTGDEALSRYCRLLTEMISNEKVRAAILADKMWFTMIAQSEQLSSLPQINRDYGTSLNQRARGLGGLTPTICAEDSIMCLPGDRWKDDCICPHETGHTLYSSGIAKVPELSKRLTEITQKARSSGRLANAYVWMDGNESGMMSWGVQAWYDCAINGTMGAYHSDINTRAELQKELPEFYQFLSEILPADNKYEDCYAK
jgi:hypothetical protein